MIFCTFPLSAHAIASNDSSDVAREELFQCAREAFPEFSYKIIDTSAESGIATYSECEPYEVYSETRSISESKRIQYREYSDGTILISSAEYDCKDPETTVNSYEGGSQAALYDVTVKAAMTSVTGYFQLSNIKFTLRNSQYDCITSLGNPSKSGKCTKYERVLPTSETVPIYENASGDAKILYNVWFQFGPGAYYTKWTQLTFYVGRNTFGCDFINLDSEN